MEMNKGHGTNKAEDTVQTEKAPVETRGEDWKEA
jgi:hypothetical protein